MQILSQAAIVYWSCLQIAGRPTAVFGGPSFGARFVCLGREERGRVSIISTAVSSLTRLSGGISLTQGPMGQVCRSAW